MFSGIQNYRFDFPVNPCPKRRVYSQRLMLNLSIKNHKNGERRLF